MLHEWSELTTATPNEKKMSDIPTDECTASSSNVDTPYDALLVIKDWFTSLEGAAFERSACYMQQLTCDINRSH